MKIIFLDIDGVLNDFERSWGEVPDYNPSFVPKCVQAFNRIIRATEAKVVLSSSWRYSILNGNMSLNGFRILLSSHSVRGELIGHTREDVATDDVFEPRWRQIADWLKAPAYGDKQAACRASGEPIRLTSYCIIDDDSDAFGGRPGVRTSGGVGLTEADADAAIEILGRVEVPA